MTLSLAMAQQNALLATYGTTFNGGTMVIYSGAVPANADAALSGDTALATIPFSATAFGAPAAGSMAANALTQENAVASGTASFYRCFASNGTTVIEQGTVATSGGDLNLNTTNIVSGGPVAVTSFVRNL